MTASAPPNECKACKIRASTAFVHPKAPPTTAKTVTSKRNQTSTPRQNASAPDQQSSPATNIRNTTAAPQDTPRRLTERAHRPPRSDAPITSQTTVPHVTEIRHTAATATHVLCAPVSRSYSADGYLAGGKRYLPTRAGKRYSPLKKGIVTRRNVAFCKPYVYKSAGFARQNKSRRERSRRQKISIKRADRQIELSIKRSLQLLQMR